MSTKTANKTVPKSQKRTPAGVCRICGCTYLHGCPGFCGWADRKQTICTICFAMKNYLASYVETCRAVSGRSLTRLLREVLNT